jgi:hypothetical protein
MTTPAVIEPDGRVIDVDEASTVATQRVAVGGLVDIDLLKRQAAALRAAAKHSEIVQVAGPLRARAGEWERAAQDLGECIDADQDAMVCLVGSLEPGMLVLVGLKRHKVIRLMQSGGQTSVHCEPVDDFPKPEYVNCMGPTSPIVVLA